MARTAAIKPNSDLMLESKSIQEKMRAFQDKPDAAVLQS
jgi:hypothetical protein